MKIFYLPKHPINEEKHILDSFHTNDILNEIMHYCYMKPVTFSMVEEFSNIPVEASAIRLTYKRVGAKNCEGVSEYVLLKDSLK